MLLKKLVWLGCIRQGSLAEMQNMLTQLAILLIGLRLLWLTPVPTPPDDASSSPG